MVQKKVPPLTQAAPHDHGPGLPDSPPRVRSILDKKQLSEQETFVWAAVEALFKVLAGKVGWIRNHCWTSELDLEKTEWVAEKLLMVAAKN